MGNNYLGEDDLVLNTTSRIPICLCIDTSGSMGNKDGTSESREKRVKKGILEFYREIKSNDMTRNAAEISIVGFSEKASVVQEFMTIDKIEMANKPINLEPHGKGDMGLGVKKALELLEKRKQSYKENGVDYYQPWLLVMTDGKPTGTAVAEHLRDSQAKTIAMEKKKKLTIITVFIGDSRGTKDLSDIDSKADRNLTGFSEKNIPQIIESTKFSDFFEWLGKSVSTVSDNSENEIGDNTFEDVDWDEI